MARRGRRNPKSDRAKSEELDLSINRRFAKGFNVNASYTRMGLCRREGAWSPSRPTGLIVFRERSKGARVSEPELQRQLNNP
jgi:hypothetical protein